MSEIVYFKDVPVKIGDIIAITPVKEMETPLSIPDQVEVAVLDIETDGYLLTLVPAALLHLANQLRIMSLNPNDVDSVRVVSEAAEAIPEQSGNQQFQPYEQVTFRAGGATCEAIVIAALEGIVAIRTDCGSIRVAVAKSFDRVRAKHTA